jgi:hypothetical protein
VKPSWRPYAERRKSSNESCRDSNRSVFKTNWSCPGPSLIESIVAGREPSGVSLEYLVKSFSLEWNQQRDELGFPSSAGAG